MLKSGAKSAIALLSLAAFAAAIATIDRTRGGPASMFSRCNLALARADLPAADVLLIGSSRSGVALDPLVLRDMLRQEAGGDPTVERLAVGNMTLRLSHALLETYLDRRGGPDVVVLEASFMTQRTVDRLATAANAKTSEHYLLERDINLMTFGQLMSQPAVAMPYTEPESPYALWELRLRGVILRAGALVYQSLKAPFEDWSFESCSHADITREETWPEGFSFAYGDHRIDGSLSDTLARLRAELAVSSEERELQEWQVGLPPDRSYPYDFDEAYRQGEMAYFTEMVRIAQAHGARVVVVPLPLYGYSIDPADMTSLADALPDGADIFDLYGRIGIDFGKFWYDDAHVEKYPTGLLTTAIMAEHLAAAPEVEADDD